jgi:hypothetical protein
MGDALRRRDSLVVEEDHSEPHCVSHLMTNGDLFKPGVYEERSQFAHQFLGVCLFAILLVWSSFILEWVHLRRAYEATGLISIVAGFYLFFWVFFFLLPDRPGELAEYALSSLVQLQHLSISMRLDSFKSRNNLALFVFRCEKSRRFILMNKIPPCPFQACLHAFF